MLAEVRTAGWSAEHGEVTAGLASVGVAVVDHLGWPAAAIAVTYPEEAVTERQAVAVPAVQDAAATLSRRIRGAR